MKIAMITSEANPLCKSGGLADVTYSLSRQLNKSGEKAIIIMPFYKKIKSSHDASFVTHFYVEMSWRKQYVGVFKLNIDGIDYYLLDNEYYFNRDNLYGYDDDNERFAYFSIASIEALKAIGFDANIIHVHDWQGGMIPCLLKEKYKYDDFYENMHTVLTIHNPAFKGMMDKYFLHDYYGLSDDLYYKGFVRFEGCVSTLKSAIVYADMITTVSPTHRNELLTNELSQGLSPILKLREDDFVGIINGLDVVEFDPKNDDKIAKKYHKDAFIRGKALNKIDLLKQFNLPIDDAPIYGLVSRLTWQKGVDLIIANISYLVTLGAKIIILGSGEKDLENKFQYLRDKYPQNVGIYIGYNDSLAHKVYAGSDFFLMPSLFEPCGIGQIIAQRYGTLPIVRCTGGLADTIIPFNNKNVSIANGFMFYDYNSIALGNTLRYSYDVYQNKETMKQLIHNSMKLDRSWNSSMKEYIDVYRKAVTK